MTVIAPLNEEAAKAGAWTRNLSDEMNAEILAEDTTDAGVPYVISKITHDSDAESCNLLLYYGHEAVLYELEVSACVGQHESMIFEDILTGIRTAKKLGIMAVAVADARQTNAEILRAESDIYIRDFFELL